MQIAVEMTQEQVEKIDPRHVSVYCNGDDQFRYLPVCERRCKSDGRCKKFWAKLDLLGIDRKDLL